MSFFQKFFGYFSYSDSNKMISSPQPYKDGLGLGTFIDLRYYLLIIIAICLTISITMIMKKNKSKAQLFLRVVCLILLVSKISIYLYRFMIKAEPNLLSAIPLDMYRFITLFLPIVVLFRLDNLKKYAYPIALLTGIYMIVVGDFFNSKFISFYTLELMTSSITLIIVVFIELFSFNYIPKISDYWKSLLILIFFISYSYIYNHFICITTKSNLMYLGYNTYPFKSLDNGYLYLNIFILLFTLFIEYYIPFLFNKKRKEN